MALANLQKNEFKIIGQLGLVQGYVNGLKYRTHEPIKAEDLAYIAEKLQNIHILIFGKEKKK